MDAYVLREHFEVDLGDSNASRTVEMLDMAQMQVCFSGDGFKFDTDPRRNCTVFDFDDDNDVDHTDFNLFHSVITGPVP